MYAGHLALTMIAYQWSTIMVHYFVCIMINIRVAMIHCLVEHQNNTRIEIVYYYYVRTVLQSVDPEHSKPNAADRVAALYDWALQVKRPARLNASPVMIVISFKYWATSASKKLMERALVGPHDIVYQLQYTMTITIIVTNNYQLTNTNYL